MCKVYILKSKNYLKTYIGITTDLEKRLKEHNLGCSFYTKKYKSWEIVYTEGCKNIQSARLKEKYLKSCAGRKRIKNILNK